MKQRVHNGTKVHDFSSMQKWESWLAGNHAQAEAIWIRFAKTGSQYTSLTYEESREAAIAYGWIDGLINKWDEDWYMRRFTQRRPRSIWSLINRGIAEQLLIEKRMQPSGLAQVNSAKADGRWEAAYSPQSQIQTPRDLLDLLKLKKNAKANEYFVSLNRTDRYSFLFRLENAKKPDARQRWLGRIIEMLATGETFRSQVRKKK